MPIAIMGVFYDGSVESLEHFCLTFRLEEIIPVDFLFMDGVIGYQFFREITVCASLMFMHIF
jgi:hypothetical protein